MADVAREASMSRYSTTVIRITYACKAKKNYNPCFRFIFFFFLIFLWSLQNLETNRDSGYSRIGRARGSSRINRQRPSPSRTLAPPSPGARPTVDTPRVPFPSRLTAEIIVHYFLRIEQPSEKATGRPLTKSPLREPHRATSNFDVRRGP